MARRITADVLTFIVALGIIYIGASFLLDPAGQAAGFGFDASPTGEEAQFLTVKGVRDIVSGVLPLTLLALGQRRALGWALLCEALIPLGDGTLILVNGGSVAIALSVHYATMVLVVVAGLLQLKVAAVRERELARVA
ncbi:DUF4267 domain-containing protein [Glycomyces sp. A-F 0318]|uniref:DUF4267 domain-containing protein n=1 Tax=Glycomyces amatae TaxID=2881355 RepID=UPI001E493555|nr:DUF4267 domain-containing protein [Glycomyces amatae]MCD0446918.1 DUF4267 domain-containing protein [Glycomyces amatae]